jgi:hypothetical protein
MHLVSARLLAVLLALLTLISAALDVRSLQAQPLAPVTLEVRAGFDGTGRYHPGHWFPLMVVAANEGGDLRGTLELSFPGAPEPAFRTPIDLPRGARKALNIPLMTQDTRRSANLRLVVAGVTQAETRITLNPLSTEHVIVGVLSSSGNLLNSLGAVQIVNGLATTVVQLEPDLLPTDATLLAGLHVIFVHDLATGTLSAEQLAALELWSYMGGLLVVGGGLPAEQTVAGLAELLPVEVGELQANVSLAPLELLARQSDLAGSLGSTTANLVTLRPGARSLDQGRLLTVIERGAGQVFFTAFDLAALRTWAGEAALWTQVLRPEPRMLLSSSFRWQNDNLLRDSLNLPSLRLPSTGLLLLMMAFYIVVIGPLNFLILRRIGRLELAWLTTPLLVLIFLGAAYGASFVIRGNQPQLTQLTLTQGFEGLANGQHTAFVGVFSPQRRSFQIDFAPETLVTPGSFEGWQFREVSVTQAESSAGVTDLLVDVSALRTLLVEQTANDIPAVRSSLERQRNRLVGEVRLEATLTLRDAMLVSGAHTQLLGDLQPGSATSIDLSLDQFNFPHQLSLNNSGPIYRDRVLSSIFGYDRFAPGGPQFGGAQGMPDDGAYLLGWGESPAVEAQIDGLGTGQQGETLYIIRLASGS